jgi:hypothetical protein
MDSSWLDEIQVEPLEDGGMGGLKLIPHGVPAERQFAREVAAVEFEDADGVKVIATLYVDDQGQPLELEVWKTDFTPLLRIPEGRI